MKEKEIGAEAQAIIVRDGEGETVTAFGDTQVYKLSSAQTKGQMAVAVALVPSNSGPPLHRHSREDELLLVVEGRLQVMCNGALSEVGAGDMVYWPRGTAHTFRTISETPAKYWLICTPGGFENFFRACAGASLPDGAPDMEKVIALGTEHGVEYLGPPLSVLMGRS